VDDFEAVQADLPRPGNAGWYERVIRDLEPDRRASLDRALAARGSITSRAISLVLRQWGYSVTEGQVAHHRRRLSEL
jgi:hypothetical protein